MVLKCPARKGLPTSQILVAGLKNWLKTIKMKTIP
jgi:hypothetical protein